jgi:hypothetical protein
MVPSSLTVLFRYIATGMAAKAWATTGATAKQSHAGPIYLNSRRWHDAAEIPANKGKFEQKLAGETLR